MFIENTIQSKSRATPVVEQGSLRGKKAKFLVFVLMLVILLGFFIPISYTKAQTVLGTCVYTKTNKTTNITTQQTQNDFPKGSCDNIAASAPPTETWKFVSFTATAETKPDATIDGAPPKTDDSCGLTNIPACFTRVIGSVAFLLMTLCSYLLFLSGTLLNFVLDYTVVNMSANIGTLTGINIGWQVIRDVSNILFIFLLLYEGIKMIIGFSDLGKVRRFIGMIVLASLLVNFSLFFTKVLIDASNIVTVGVYNSLLDNVAVTVPGSNNPGPTAPRSVSGLSAPFMRSLNLATVYDSGGLNLGETAKLIIYLMGSILFLVLSFVFFAVACMFVIRYVALILLLILSPIAYMGMALPFLKPYADQWWNALDSQLLFAPIYMIITSVTLTLMSSPGFNTSSQGSFAGIANGDTSSLGLILNYAMVIGLSIAGLVIAKNTSTKGSSYIAKATGNLTAFAGGAVMGTGAWVGRQSIGRIGDAVANNANLQGATERGGLIGAGARALLYTGKKAQSGSFDARSATIPTGAIGDLIQGTVGRTRIGRGLGLNDVAIPSVAIGSMLAAETGVGKGGTKGFKETKEESEKRVRERENAAASELRQSQAKKAILDGATATPGTPVGDAAINSMEQELSKLSAKQTEALVASNRELLDSQNFANKISVQQLEAINKSDQFSEEEKNKLKNKRFKQIETIYNPAALAAYTAATAIPVGTRTPAQEADIKLVDDARARVKGLSDSELEMINPDYLDPAKPEGRQFIAQLRPGQVETITANKSGKFTSSQKDNIKRERMRPLKDALTAGSVADVQRIVRASDAKTMVSYLKEDGRGVPPVKIALDPAVLPIYTPKTLQRMAAQDSMSDSDIHTLRMAILGAGLPATNPTIVWLNDPNKGGELFP